MWKEPSSFEIRNTANRISGPVNSDVSKVSIMKDYENIYEMMCTDKTKAEFSALLSHDPSGIFLLNIKFKRKAFISNIHCEKCVYLRFNSKRL